MAHLISSKGVVGAGASLRRSILRTVDISCFQNGGKPFQCALSSPQSFTLCKVLLLPGTCSSSEMHQQGPPVRVRKFIGRGHKELSTWCWQQALESSSGNCTGTEQSKNQRTILLQRVRSLCNYSSPAQKRFQTWKGKGLITILPYYSVRSISTPTAVFARQKPLQDEQSERDLTRQEDPFDTITDKIPEKPVSVAEGASYSVVILLGLGIAGAAAYAVFKELVFEPKEYKVYGKALDRVQHDSQVSGRLGAPITGYGQESRNRAARQRISNRAWTDELGIERVEVMFHIRGPGGAGKVYSEMFKDPEDKTWKYTYLIVDVMSPTPIRLMLESYVPSLVPLSTS